MIDRADPTPQAARRALGSLGEKQPVRALIIVAAALLAPADALAQTPPAPTPAERACNDAQYGLNATVIQINQAQESYRDLAMNMQMAEQQYRQALAENSEVAPGTLLGQFNPNNPVSAAFNRWQYAWGQAQGIAYRIKSLASQAEDLESSNQGCNLAKPALPPVPQPPPAPQP